MLRLGEEGDNTFTLVVGEALPGAPVQTQVGEARPLRVSEGSRIWKISWDQYVAYSVRNESYATLDEGETWQDNRLRQKERSAFLDYVSRSTLASDDYPGPMQCWSFDSLNHCVDVVSTEAPSIESMSVEDLGDMGLGLSLSRVSNYVK